MLQSEDVDGATTYEYLYQGGSPSELVTLRADEDYLADMLDYLAEHCNQRWGKRDPLEVDSEL